MGCVSSESSSSPSKKSLGDLVVPRNSSGEPLNDADIVKKQDEQRQIAKLNKAIEEMNKKLQSQTTQILKLKKQNELTKKQSQNVIAEKQIKLKLLEKETKKEVDTLKQQLQKQKQKQKQQLDNKGKLQPIKKQKQSIAVGLLSLQKHKSLCQECFYKLARYTSVNPSMGECYNCRGYGLVLDRFPYGANPSCEKSLCFSKGWDKVKCLRVCTICAGKGFQQNRGYIARRL